jgi:hypothetical protein
MSTPAPRPTFPWGVVLCLVGLDYFSSLAYLPSIATAYTGKLAPLAALAVVLVTLGAAVPVYWYVVGRSADGRGGIGLLERCASGWRGKLLLLVLLGFVATDFVMTRTLSVSDAAAHVAANPVYREHAEGAIRNKEVIRGWMPELLAGRFFDFWNEQLLITLVLSVAGFGVYFFLLRSLSRGFMGFAVGVVLLYLLMNVLVLGSALFYLQSKPDLVLDWEHSLRPEIGNIRTDAGGAIRAALLLGFLAFPAMAIGLSGFELTLTAAPLVAASPGDSPKHPRGRIFRSRLMILTAAVVMCLLVLGSTFVVTLLVPEDALKTATGEVQHRSLSYLAHGELLSDKHRGEDVISLFGSTFGTIYDISTVFILCLAGASATVSLKDMVPEFLSRFGMQLTWAHRLDIITHLFNGVVLLVTIAFQASVSAQLGAYAAAVLALLFGASLAAMLDVGLRWKGATRRLGQFPFFLATLLFAVMGILIVIQQGSGVLIALAFVAVVLGTAITSRWLRSTELRFVGFEFADGPSAARWAEIRNIDFQVLVPHDPHSERLSDKEGHIRDRHRIGENVPIIFIEVSLGDTSDFYQKPLMSIARDDGREVIRVSRCTSIAHVIASIALEFREVGQPPELHFGWSDASPMAANLGFLLFGQGNIPWMVHALLRKAEPKPERRPRVLIG